MDWWWGLLKAMDDHEGQAAWAQAVATAVALFLALRQGYAAARRERVRDRAAATAAYTLVSNASRAIAFMQGDFLVATGAARVELAQRLLKGGRLSELEASLAGFDISSLPHPLLVTGFTRAQTALREYHLALEGIASPPKHPLLYRDHQAPVLDLRKAETLMLAPLLSLSPGARWRRVREKVERLLFPARAAMRDVQ